jgi:para-nitrobenzyl esterase
MHITEGRPAQIRLAGLFLAGTLLAWPQVTVKPVEGDPVRIDSGLVSGTYLRSGAKAYLGVPFAAPPVRELRWKAPQPVTAWTGIYTANRLPPECPQALRDSDTNHYFGEEPVSEDCLYLNIWAPAAAKAGARLPVVVWVYGGGFTGGSSGMAIYGGENLAKKGVVYVSFNYRLGILGFLAHPELTRESGHNASGNWGFLDQVAALQWIHRNIAKFGGDAGNVTLIGQSAGSMAICDLQASPLTRGLFQKAFGQSGSTLGGQPALGGQSLANAEATGLKFQEAVKAASMAGMRSLSSDKVMAEARTERISAGPSIDGYFLPKSPAAIFGAREQNDVPLVVGWTANDIGTAPVIRSAKNLEEYQAAAAKMYGPKAAAFLQLYPAKDDAEARKQAELIGRSSGFGVAARLWAKAQTATGKAPAYLFLFSRSHAYAEGVAFSNLDPKTAGAYHMADTPYWLDTIDSFDLFRVTRAWTAYDRELANKMSDIVVAFARTGTPGTQAVKMVKYDARDEQATEFGDSIQVMRINGKGMDFLTENPPPQAGRGGRGGS